MFFSALVVDYLSIVRVLPFPLSMRPVCTSYDAVSVNVVLVCLPSSGLPPPAAIAKRSMRTRGKQRLLSQHTSHIHPNSKHKPVA